MTDIVYNKNGIPFDIDAIATDLNGKADRDLTNASMSTSFIIQILNKISPDYSNVITIPSGTSSYTASSYGYISFNLDAGTDNCTINGNTVYVAGNDSSNEGPVQLFLSPGDVINLPTTSSTSCFIPLKYTIQ